MPDYDLERLGAQEFERLCQSLLKAVLKAPGTITFGEGADGAREATFTGKVDYPSSKERWDGHWIFQVKFHDIKRVGADKARAILLTELDSELDKICNKYKHPCDNYILLTNVRLWSAYRTGTHDKVDEIAARYEAIRHVHVWGGDEICRHLENHPDTRRAYTHLVTPGDLIAELMAERRGARKRLAETVRLFLQDCFEKDQFAQLDQAGETDPDRTTLLRSVFVDLEIRPQGKLVWSRENRSYAMGAPPPGTRRERLAELESTQEDLNLIEELWEVREETPDQKTLSAVRSLVSEKFPRLVLIGGPGHGKSTLGQYVAQIHRAFLLHRTGDFDGELPSSSTPVLCRIPFRAVLKYFAQWLSEQHSIDSLEAYIAELAQRATSRRIEPEDIQEVFRDNPCLLILDGLDEVIDPKLRSKTLDRINEFLARMQQLHGDIQVLATSRPTGYSKEFNPEVFLHFDLLPLSQTRATQYAKRWVEAKNLLQEERQRVLSTFEECQEAGHTKQLLTTPLQVTIVLLIIKDKGQPPSQREGLFNKYWETILSREKAKARDIIKSEEGLLFNLHAYLAYLLHRRAAKKDVRSLLAKDEFLKEVRRFLRSSDRRSADEIITQRAEQLVTEASNRLVLLVEPLPGLFGFELRSFQEFFAAAHLAQSAKDTQQRFRRLKAIAKPDHWRNVALFFVGRIMRNNVGEAANILEVVCRPLDRGGWDQYLKPGGWLSLDIGADRAMASNRDLQYNTLEYGLTVLEGSLSDDQKEPLKRIVSSLSSEDKQDIVQPILSEKMRHLQLPYLRNASWLYSEIFGDDQVLREGLERCFASSRSTDRQFALGAALRVHAHPNWLSKIFASYPPLREEFLSDFTDYIEDIGGPYLVAVLEAIALTRSEAERILSESDWFLHGQPVAEGVGLENLETPAVQTAATLNLAQLLLSSSPWHRHRWARYEDSEAAHRILQGLLENIDAALCKEDILPPLRGLLCIAKFVANRATSETISEFFAQIPRINMSVRFWNIFLGAERSLLRHAVKLITSGKRVPEALFDHLKPEKEASLTKQLLEMIRHDMESLPGDRRTLLETAIYLEDSEEIARGFPSLGKIEKQLGVSGALLVQDIITSFTPPGRWTKTNIEYCLGVMQRRLNEKGIIEKVHWFASGRWPDDKALWARALGLLIRIVGEQRKFTPREIIAIGEFFLKVGSYSDEAWEEAPAVLKRLSLISAELMWRRQMWLGLEEQSLKRLSKISRFLRSRNPDIQRGAALLAEMVAHALSSPQWRFRWPHGEPAIYRRIDWRAVLKLAEHQDLSLARQGLAIFVLCDPPVTDASGRRRLLSALRRAEHPSLFLEKAWVAADK
jgi:hypothetical protein